VDGKALAVGDIEGLAVGYDDGRPLGCEEYDGLVVGVSVGYCDGDSLGEEDGESDRRYVGLCCDDTQ